MDCICGDDVLPPLSGEELLWPMSIFLFFFIDELFIEVIEEEPESDELGVENKLVVGDPEEEVDEEEEWDLFLLVGLLFLFVVAYLFACWGCFCWFIYTDNIQKKKKIEKKIVNKL